MKNGSKAKSQELVPLTAHSHLLYHFCRMHLPAIAMAPARVAFHLQRTFDLYASKENESVDLQEYLLRLYQLDWFIACGCLEGGRAAWDHLFAAHAGRADCLLIDALRARAVRLYPRNEERQDSVVDEFWSHLIVSETPGSVPILARYDGQRPLIPWLIRVFQNWHISQLRHHSGAQALPQEDPAQPPQEEADGRWHEEFCLAAREHLPELNDNELLILGLRLRYRMSQREVAALLGVHEGTISRQTTHVRDRLLNGISQRLIDQGWTGEDLSNFVLREMGSLLLDEPRLSASQLAGLLAARGKSLPMQPPDSP
ncbi:MAG TPA: sigma-70 family RNA polymerase sigma factor [Gemmataceae bacterium]|nr:sigma-70 family RNA polymerase sigma factor [Gemmataceae bacterium]